MAKISPVRRAAVDALGPLNGTVVVTQPETGRMLTIVNQKLALQSGYQPCSTVKVPVALAALSEAVVDRADADSRVRPHHLRHDRRRWRNRAISISRAWARSWVSIASATTRGCSAWARKPVWISTASSREFCRRRSPKSGMGMMTSFGDGITLTPLEFAALIGAVANGGTLYYLQYPKTQQEAQALMPRVKRRLDIEALIPEIKPGMMGAVEYGTARRIGFDPNEPIYGKTGTCTDTRTPTHLGWFGSFAEVGQEQAGGGGAADGRKRGQRSGGVGRRGRGVQESGASELLRAGPRQFTDSDDFE